MVIAKRKAKKKSSPSISSVFPDYTKRKYKELADTKRRQFVSDLRDIYKHRGLVLYVGAGVSRSLGLPNWSELIRSLTVRMMTRKVDTAVNAFGGLSDEQRWQATISIQEQVANEDPQDKPILMMARAIKTALGESLPLLVAWELYRSSRQFREIRFRNLAKKHVIRPDAREVRLPTSPLLNALVAIARSERHIEGVQAIVNYNYDDIFDETLRRENVHCLTIRSGKDRVPQGFLPCYHVHGVLPVQKFITWIEGGHPNPFKKKSVGNFVFSEDEYHAEYSDPYKWSNMTQISLLSRYTGLFIGLSLQDPNVRRLLDVTHQQYPEIVNYAILVRKHSLSRRHDSKQTVLYNLFEEVETSSFEDIGMKVIWVDSYEEIPKVIKQMCELDFNPVKPRRKRRLTAEITTRKR